MRIEKRNILELTADKIEKIHECVLNDPTYGKEGSIIHEVLNAYPSNNDMYAIAMKIAVIDVTNSTNLSRNKNRLSLYDLAEFICKIPNFDERVAEGDPELVNIIARNIEAVNLFSFASKYCTYHNVKFTKEMTIQYLMGL